MKKERSSRVSSGEVKSDELKLLRILRASSRDLLPRVHCQAITHHTVYARGDVKISVD